MFAFHFPQLITIVGWIFKEERFTLHARTLGLSNDEFRYVGVSNPSIDSLDGALRGERKVLLNFIETPFGDSGKLLMKRQERDPFNEGNPW